MVYDLKLFQMLLVILAIFLKFWSPPVCHPPEGDTQGPGTPAPKDSTVIHWDVSGPRDLLKVKKIALLPWSKPLLSQCVSSNLLQLPCWLRSKWTQESGLSLLLLLLHLLPGLNTAIPAQVSDLISPFCTIFSTHHPMPNLLTSLLALGLAGA